MFFKFSLRIPLLLLFSLFLSFLVWAEEGDDLPVMVKVIIWDIHDKDSGKWGTTKKIALQKYYDIKEGEIFKSSSALEAELEFTTRDLNSQQIFKELNYDIVYDEFLPLELKDTLKVAYIVISVTDGTSLYFLPYVLYDSNLGTIYGGSFSYNNFLGSLTNLNTEGYLGDDSWFTAAQWENVILGPLKGNFFLEYEAYTTKRVDSSDEIILQYTNYEVDLSLELLFPLSRGYSISVQPGFYLPYGYELESYSNSSYKDEFEELGPVVSAFFKGGVIYNNTIWEDQFRKGGEFETYFTVEGTIGDVTTQLSLDGSASLFYRVTSYLGLAHNLSAYYVFNGTRDNSGQYIRGVLDYLMFGQGGVYLNNNIDFHLFTIQDYLDFHGYPLVDLAFVYNSDPLYTAYDFRVTAGYGLTVYPLFLQSLNFNLELGMDILNGGEPEITFSSELFF